NVRPGESQRLHYWRGSDPSMMRRAASKKNKGGPPPFLLRAGRVAAEPGPRGFTHQNEKVAASFGSGGIAAAPRDRREVAPPVRPAEPQEVTAACRPPRVVPAGALSGGVQRLRRQRGRGAHRVLPKKSLRQIDPCFTTLPLQSSPQPSGPSGERRCLHPSGHGS